ncbi:hypothetical protein JCM8097_006737 [Rhodosporidiobolus ruineniae]
MAKSSGRFRNRKLGFKTRIAVEIGVVLEEDPVDEVEVEDDKGRKGMETGVDKDEEGEVHLQAVIASANAYVSRSSSSSGKKHQQAYIPTRTSSEISDAEYYALYKPGYVDPFSYIRFSDQVEDCIKGAVTYTMDEDDEDWLEDFNAQFLPGAKPRRASQSNGAGDDDVSGTPSGRGARNKGKAAAVAPDVPEGTGLAALPTPSAPLSEDDFELLMEVFELVTDQKAPMAHVNVNLLPALDDFDDELTDILKPHLAKLRPYAKDVYPHWRSRRVARGGKSVIPQLDYDESNENNPYVCFRRRELKTSRKTRRSDQQNLERLIRLRNDLFAAHALMLKVQERERLKLDGIQVERKVFEGRCEVRELKRRLNEPDGDEDLLVSRREKKRRREDSAAGPLRLSLRKPDPSNLSPASLVAPLEELQNRKLRNESIAKQIERDLGKKKQGDQLWDDWTDSSYLARPPPTPARFWRAVEPVPHSVPFNGPAGKREALGFATGYQVPLGRVRPSFRKRVGRGGRVLLDRIGMVRDGEAPAPRRRRLLPPDEDATEDEDEEEDEWFVQRRAERLKYDTDVALDFPTADEPVLIDDFDLPYLLRRIGLLKQADIDALGVDSSYLDAAFQFVASDPDKNQPPPTVVGRPPARPPLQMAPQQAAAATAPAPPQLQPGAGGPATPGIVPGQPGPPNAAAYAQAQQQLAAQQALRVAQQQAAMRKQQQAAMAAAGVGAGGDAMRRTPSSNQTSPQQGQALQPLQPLPNGVGAGASPAAQYQLPGAFPQGSPHSSSGGMPLGPPPPRPNGLAGSPQPQAQQLLQQQQQIINGANGLPATSRLSAPPYSNNPALQLALQAQAAQAAAVAAANGGSPVALAAQLQRPMSANGLVQIPGMPPSRPTSAAGAGAQHSPHLVGGALPLPPGVGVNGSPTAPGLQGLRPGPTPPPGGGMKRASPLPPPGAAGLQQQQQQAQQQYAAAMAQQYGGFVQG